MSQGGPEFPPAALPAGACFTVRFEDGSATFTAGADQPLLDAAAQAGVTIPSSCRNGSCRTCMCLVLSGEVSYRIQWPGLLPEERAAGWILTCIAYARSDLLLRRAPPSKDWRDQFQSLPVV